MGILIFVISLLNFTTAPPNPVTDDLIDESEEEEEQPYKYPDIEKSSEPYWKAFSKENRLRLMEHDRLEINMLARIKKLDFKLRETWTPTDKPFAAKD